MNLSADDVRSVLRASYTHSDRRAAATISLLLSNSVPLYIQELLRWKDLIEIDGPRLNMKVRRPVTLRPALGSAPLAHLRLLRKVSTRERIFATPMSGSAKLVPLVNDIVLQAGLRGYTHRDLLSWSRRLSEQVRLSLATRG